MTSWSIDPAGVVQVMTNVELSATALGEALTGLQPQFESAIAGAQSAAIAEAIQGWMDHESTALKGVNQRITAAMTGASAATQAYIDGDLEMAANVQSAQVTAGNRPPGWTPPGVM